VTSQDQGQAIIDIFDRDKFVHRNLGDLDLSRDVATIFIDSAPEYIKSIRNALDAFDSVALRQSAHKLKGAADNLALSSLSKIAGRIETIAQTGDFEINRQLLPELELQFEQAEIALKNFIVTFHEKASL
jgi:HPt (histidine-containing phosphotransfer) domain-containing protein